MDNREDSFLRRIRLVFYLVILLLLLIFLRLVLIQVIDRQNYIAELAPQIDTEYNTIKAERGDILDRDGNELAVSRTFFQLDINPSLLSTAEKDVVIKNFPKILGLSQAEIKGFLNSSQYVMVSSSLTNSQKIAIEKFGILNGVSFTKIVKRAYPLASDASTILGAVGLDGDGLAGAEYYFDSFLEGRNGRTFRDFTSTKPIMPGEASFSVQPVKGDSITLTIDSNIQFEVQKLLEAKVKEVSAKRGLAIVMDVNTGEILSLANYPTFDPETFSGFSDAINMAVNYNYEPGSVIKPVVAAIALENGTLHTDDSFYCSGSIKVKDRIIHCWQTHGEEHGLNEIMKNSCDVAFVQIGLKLGKEKLLEGFKSFGFGEPTGIELPSEEKGILPDVNNIGDVEVANMSFGQGIAVTPLQLISAFQAIANKGIQLKPTIVKEIRDSKGQAVFKSKPLVERTVVSEDTASKVMDSLRAVVEDGGVPQAKIPGYAIAGKTGTAQKVLSTGGYSSQKLIYSFCGIIPADKPQFAVLVVLDETPTPTYALNIAAPLFKQIGEFLIRYERIEKTNP
jgi:stage V sporulation protein D (sporulation-specific penicillin-binding protein)